MDGSVTLSAKIVCLSPKHIDKEEVGTVFKVMETNLIRIGHVAFIATWLSGGLPDFLFRNGRVAHN